MSIEILIGIGSLLLAWLGFLEKRLRSLMSEFDYKLNERDAKLESKHKISEVIQQTLKEDIAEIKVKIDMLIALQIDQNKRQ